MSIRHLKMAAFVCCLVPLLALGWRGAREELGANPIEFITHATGDWTLRFLLMTLAITAARKLLDIPQLIRFRRMLGLFAFCYGFLHLITYIWLDKFFDFDPVLRDIGKRLFIMMGFSSLLITLPLAITSTAAWIRRLGGRRWQLLHRFVYFSAAAGVIHYYWLVKSDIRLPVLYAIIVSALLGYRVAVVVRKRHRKIVQSPTPA
jgi:methionine sulfoxide reductase heme-binding subunit